MSFQVSIVVPMPCSKDTEMAILGKMLTNKFCLEHCLIWLKDSDFFFIEHQAIFQALKELRKADVHIIQEHVKGKNLVAVSLTCLEALIHAANYNAEPLHANVETLISYAQRRQTLQIGQDLIRRAVAFEYNVD